MLKGIDVSSHDGFNGSKFSSNTESCYQDSDFVIVKATQGLTYVFSGCDPIYQRAKRDGKLLGTYHYAGGNDPGTEAEYFYKNIKGYIGEAIPCLDFEEYQNKSWHDKNWCLKFVKKFHELSGVYPLIYTAASQISRIENCADLCGLWVAGYPTNNNSWELPKFRYTIKPWKAWSIWQYSSSNEKTDRNYAQLTAESWAKIAKGSGVVVAEEPIEASEAVKDKDIAEVQEWLNNTYNAGLAVDGIYGEKTHAALVAALQTELNKQFNAGLDVDGIWGPKTKAACANVRKGAQGNLTRIIQCCLLIFRCDVSLDGIFGEKTESAVKEFQSAKGISIDGVVGINTWTKMLS